jgi:hypothetical protein
MYKLSVIIGIRKKESSINVVNYLNPHHTRLILRFTINHGFFI